MTRWQVPAAVAGIGVVLMAAVLAAGQALAPEFRPGSGTGAELLLEVSAVPSQTAVVPGEKFYLAVQITVGKGWVLYSPAPGGGDVFAPVPARVAVEAPGWRVEEALWPVDQEHQTPVDQTPVTTFVYTGAIMVYVPIAVPGDTSLGAQELRVRVTGLVCSEERFKCVPVRGEAMATVDVGPVAAGNPDWTEARRGLTAAVPADSLRGTPVVPTSAPAPTELSLWGGLGLAALAGLIMNVMPCVLPVIPVRILSIVELARQSRRRYVTVGLTFALGIVLFFVAVAAANVVLRREWGWELDWGRHFQYAPFRLGMAMVVVAVAANLFGVFEILLPRRLVELDGSMRTQGHMASLGMGLMMAILSTPCSFALLVVAFAWAQTQPLWLGSLALVVMGVGMAAPHVLLAACPWMVRWLPRPGRWMELLRQAMGFLLLGVAVWLIGTLSSDARIPWTLGFAVALVFCLWVWGTVVRFGWPTGAKMLVRWLAVVAAVAAGAWMLTPPKGLAVRFQPFDEAQITQVNRSGKIVLVEFTAAWCLSCELVDHFIYDSAEIAAELEDRGVLAMRADVTSADSPANELLYDRLGGAPPLTVIYPPSGPPIRLEGKFSRLDLVRALNQAAPRQSRPAD